MESTGKPTVTDILWNGSKVALIVAIIAGMAQTYFGLAQRIEEGRLSKELLMPPPLVVLVARMLKVVQVGGILAFCVGPRTIFIRTLKMQYIPNWWSRIEQAAVQWAILLYLVLPPILGALHDL